MDSPEFVVDSALYTFEEVIRAQPTGFPAPAMSK